jgi:hypothetical protein
VSPTPHPLDVLHYAIKSVITILDAELQMSQITITHGKNTLPHLLSQLPSLIQSDKDVRVKMEMGTAARIKKSRPSY